MRCYFTCHKKRKNTANYLSIFHITYILTFYLSILLILGYFFQASDAGFEADAFYNLAVEFMRILYNKQIFYFFLRLSLHSNVKNVEMYISQFCHQGYL